MTAVSLVLPYFNRAEATTRALKHHAKLYPDLDMEIVIVDDGSEQPYYAPQDLPWRVRVVHLPKKDRPLNPCLPINIGVASAAAGSVIAISSPEIMHRAPVLPALAATLAAADYVAAACWCPEQQRWHAHSTRTPLYADRTQVQMPAGAQYHFLAVVARDTWRACGGFDNDYRDGAGYDDNDFLMRLAKAGASFAIRDDLIVEHTRENARARWTREMFDRNRGLFESKWAA